MPFDKKKYKSYCVAFGGQDDAAGATTLFALLLVIWIVLLLMGFANGFGSDSVSSAIGVALTAALGLLVLYAAPRKKAAPKKLWVSGDMFYTEQDGRRGKVYLFSEITRVRLYYPMAVGGGRMPTLRVSSMGIWQIYVDGKCVAAFSEKMKNSGRLVRRLDEMGLITPHGTGLKPTKR